MTRPRRRSPRQILDALSDLHEAALLATVLDSRPAWWSAADVASHFPGGILESEAAELLDLWHRAGWLRREAARPPAYRPTLLMPRPDTSTLQAVEAWAMLMTGALTLYNDNGRSDAA